MLMAKKVLPLLGSEYESSFPRLLGRGSSGSHVRSLVAVRPSRVTMKSWESSDHSSGSLDHPGETPAMSVKMQLDVSE